MMLNGKDEHRAAKEHFVWAKADFSKLSDHISSLNWFDVFDGMSVNNCYVFFVQEYENVCAKFIPKSTKTITDDKDPWVTSTVTAAIRQKRELWTKYIIAGKFTQTSIVEEHKKASKHVDKTGKRAIRDYEEQLVLKAASIRNRGRTTRLDRIVAQKSQTKSGARRANIRMEDSVKWRAPRISARPFTVCTLHQRPIRQLEPQHETVRRRQQDNRCNQNNRRCREPSKRHRLGPRVVSALAHAIKHQQMQSNACRSREG